MPASPDQVLQFGSDLFWQLGPEVFLCKLGDDLLDGQLPVLPIFGDDLVQDHSKGVHVCRSFRFHNYGVFIFEVLDRGVHVFVGVTSDERKILPEGVQSAAVEDDLLFF